MNSFLLTWFLSLIRFMRKFKNGSYDVQNYRQKSKYLAKTNLMCMVRVKQITRRRDLVINLLMVEKAPNQEMGVVVLQG